MEIALEGPLLTPQQRERLLRAAARCPVKRMMGGEMRDGIRTVEAGGSAGGGAAAAAAAAALPPPPPSSSPT